MTTEAAETIERLGNSGLCGVCARRCAGIGFKPPGQRGAKVLWVCDDPECISIARETYSMKQLQFDRLEGLAAGTAGQKFGEVLVEANAAHVFEGMDPELFDKAIRAAIAGYRSALKESVGEIPF